MRRGSLKSTRDDARYAGVLPYALHKGVKYYLVGKEHLQEGWDGSGKWSDFGGDPEDETPLMGAAREFYEETMGFFGNLSETVTSLRRAKRIPVPGGYTYLMKIKYDASLPGLFQRVHRYFMQCAKMHKYKKGYMGIPSCPAGLFEKTDIKWVSEAELRAAVSQRTMTFRTQFLRSLLEIL